MGQVVTDLDCLFARFSIESGKLTAGYAKPKLFEPNIEGVLSVFSVDGLTKRCICELGVSQVGKPQNKRLYGWAELSCRQIGETGLTIDQDNDPPGHANVVGWPVAREDRKQKALELAHLANAVRLESPASQCEDCVIYD